MRHSNIRPVIIVLVVALVFGLGAGWRYGGDNGDQASTHAQTGGEPVAFDDLDAAAPSDPLPPAVNPALVDAANVIGYPSAPVAHVPAGAAVELVAAAGGGPRVIDRATGQEVTVADRSPLPPVEAVASDVLGEPAAPEPTLEPQDPETTPPREGGGDFVDPCTTSVNGCPGAPGAVRAAPVADEGAAAPVRALQLSYPFPAVGAFADECATIEGAAVPDPQLASGVRPTVAVLTNQPSSIAFTGTWADGAPIDKVTMLTLADHDRDWQVELAAGNQRQVLACLTLPLDVVRSHATAGTADLTINLIAISAEGRTEMRGALALTVPLDGFDAPFGDSPTITNMGERPLPDGSLAATVHVHYAIDTAVAIPSIVGLDPTTAVLHDTTAFVENADCSGWAVNRQGQDRTLDATYSVRGEQRTMNGRLTPVTVVDSDIRLDQAMRGGWEGHVCVRIFARDQFGNEVTVALRGATVRAPRTASYDIGVQLAGAAPDGWKVEATWSRQGQPIWCGPATLAAPAGGATTTSAGDSAVAASCTTLARLVPDGVAISLTPIDPDGKRGQTITYTVAINTAYCNPDDPFGWIGDGCDTGYVQLVELPTSGSAGDNISPLRVTIVVLRTAAPGQVATNPSHAWRIDPVQSFRS